jgi:hypothetical protein
MANVKVFADRQTDKQTDRRTGQKLYAPDLSIRGHKKTVQYSVAWVNIQQGQYSTSRGHQKLRINVSAKLLKNDPGYIFNDSRGSIFNVEK